jgi:hypothetical protein
MTASPSFSSARLTVIALLVIFIASGCSKQEEPRTQSGEPIPFDHMATLPSGHPPMPGEAGSGARSAAPASRPQAGQAARSITVSVKLSPALAAKAAPNDALYIFARAAQGPKMPLAIVRKQVRELPLTVTLDDSMAMVPEMKMSSFPELVIGARVSKSGDAITKPGDLEGYSPPLKSGAASSVEIVIDSVAGSTASPMPANRPADAAHATDFQHAKSGMKTRLNIPAEVKAKWKSTELSVAGKDIPVRKLQIAIGGETGIDKSGLTLRVLAYVPSFVSDAGTVTSASNNPENPAVLVQLVDKGQVLSEGWVFQNLPDFNTYANDKLQVKLLAASTGT